MKMKYEGYKVNINKLDNGLKTALKVSEILKGFRKEGLKVEVDTQQLRIDEEESNVSFPAVIFKVFLPKKKKINPKKKKKINSKLNLIPFNFMDYLGTSAMYEIPNDPEGLFQNNESITLIYHLEYTISDLLVALATIDTLGIRGEKFHPLRDKQKHGEKSDFIVFNGYTLTSSTLSYRNEYLHFNDFMPGIRFQYQSKKNDDK